MRRTIVAAALVVILLAGCSKVRMSADYAKTLEMSEVVVAELNARCQAGDPNACEQGLAEASKTLSLLVDALHGKGADE